MSSFTDVEIAKLLKAETVYCSALLFFDFKSQPMWIWEGAYPLTDLSGQVWQGTVLNDGAVTLAMTGLERIAADVSAPVNFTLSGVTAQSLRLAKEAGEEVAGRTCKIYMQVFNDNGIVGNPILINSLIMDQVKLNMVSTQERKIELTAENIFASKRRRLVNSLYTHRDQQGRFAGDKGFEFVAKMVQHTVKWPNW